MNEEEYEGPHNELQGIVDRMESSVYDEQEMGLVDDFDDPYDILDGRMNFDYDED